MKVIIMKNKFDLDDKVRFTFNGGKMSGTVFFVDKWGTFQDRTEVSYDIMGEDGVLYKHVKQSLVEADE